MHTRLDKLLHELTDLDGLVLLDMPVGLPHADSPVRKCDRAARRLLGRRGVTVFSPPCREALSAKSYRQACSINQRVVGRKISLQAWNIAPKIRECDQIFRSRPALSHRLLEAHPELCFAALAGGPLSEPKRTAQGRARRLALLEGVLPAAGAFFRETLGQTSRKALAPDDLLDAMTLAWAAARGRQGLLSLPLDDQGAPRRNCDSLGLPMRIMAPTSLPALAQSSSWPSSASTARRAASSCLSRSSTF